MTETEIFNREKEKVPFIGCINENALLTEFRNADKKPNFELFSLEKIGQPDQNAEYETAVRKYRKEFEQLILENELPEKFYIHDITQTEMYKFLFEIDEVYYNFLKTISNNNSLGLFALQEVQGQRNDFDRYKEPEITAKRIFQLLEYFDISTRERIINYIINEDSVKKDIVTFHQTNPKETADIEKVFHTFLLENLKETKVVQETPDAQPENDFSDNEDKVKVILLEKLGIIEKIKSLQTNPETVKHTAEILSSITGIKAATLFSYLRPILQPYRDDNDKNSPYKNPTNQLKANKTIQKLKIKDVGN